MDEGAAQGQLLLHAAGELPRQAVLERLYLPVNVRYQGVILADGGAEDGGKELQVLLHGEVLVEGELAGHVADALADGAIVPHHVPPADGSRALVRQHQGGKDAEEGGLPRPVRPDDAVEFARLHGEGQAVQGLHLAVGFAEMVCRYCFHSSLNLISPYMPRLI